MAMSSAAARRLKLAFVVGGVALILTRLLLAPAAELGEAEAAAPRRAERAQGAEHKASAAAPATAELMTERLQALRGDADDDENTPSAQSDTTLFTTHSWQPPAPPTPKPPPPPPPQAPPFPYAYFGGLNEGGVRTAFFLNGNRVIALHSGDVIGSFRIDSIDEQQATMTYLPLSYTVTVPFGSNR